MQGKRTATATAAQRTADHGDQKGEVNMTTPNTGELLVQQAQEAERLRLLILADECKTIEEFREKLRELQKHVPVYVITGHPPKARPDVLSPARAASSPPPGHG